MVRQKEVESSSRDATAVWTHGMRCDVTTGSGFSIVTDEPPERDGNSEGATPLEHLTAALASCQATQIAKVAKAMRFACGEVTVTATAVTDYTSSEKGNDRVLRFDAPDLDVLIETDEPPERVERLRILSEDRCPVGNLFGDAGLRPVIRWEVRAASR